MTVRAGDTNADSASFNDERPSVLLRVQRGLEALYRVETRLHIDAFVMDESARSHALTAKSPAPEMDGGNARRPREQLLVSQDGDDVAVGLFLDGAALANLERHDPASGLSEVNFADFCLAVEGVSHFVYLVVCAARDRSVTPLELELQAEVDKFISCLLLQQSAGAIVGTVPDAGELRQLLFNDVQLAHDLDEGERSRYQAANDQARRYASSLERRFIRGGRLPAMLDELRRFYRLGLRDKLGHIAQAA